MKCMFVKYPAHYTSDYLSKPYIFLVIVSSFVFPQVGGLSALQRSRVGSLLPISTPTVVHGMTWSWVPQKPGKVSHCKLSHSCPPTHTSTPTTFTHCYIPTHRYHLCPQSSVFDLWQNGATAPLLHRCRPTLTADAVLVWTTLSVCLPS